MSFLFEIQNKKSKNQTSEKKRVSMDVRAPQQAAQASRFTTGTRRPAAGSFSYTPNSYGRESFGKVSSSYIPTQYPRKNYQEISLQREQGIIQDSLGERIFSFVQDATRRIRFSLPGVTPNKLVYGSIMSGVAFGMVSLGLIEKTFESNADASEQVTEQKVEAVNLQTGNYNPEKDVFMQYFSDAADAEYQESVREMVKGHPIEEMLPYIFEKDRVTAAFLIGIAKKESNWGKRRPVLDGQDCFNYWGYRGQRRLMGSGGHTCFNSRKDAVDTVAKRLETLINSERLNTPAKLIVWKCGMSCEGHGRESVEKWISDVDAYYSEMMALESENTEIENEEEGS